MLRLRHADTRTWRLASILDPWAWHQSPMPLCTSCSGSAVHAASLLKSLQQDHYTHMAIAVCILVSFSAAHTAPTLMEVSLPDLLPFRQELPICHVHSTYTALSLVALTILLAPSSMYHFILLQQRSVYLLARRCSGSRADDGLADQQQSCVSRHHSRRVQCAVAKCLPSSLQLTQRKTLSMARNPYLSRGICHQSA